MLLRITNIVSIAMDDESAVIHNSNGLPFVQAAIYWCTNDSFKDQWKPQLDECMLYRSEQTREELEAHVQWTADTNNLSCAHLTDMDVRVLVGILDSVTFIDPVPSWSTAV